MKPLVLLVLLLQTPAVPTFKLSGRLVTAPNNTAVPTTVKLRSMSEPSGRGRTTRVNADGTFEFSGVVPSEYDVNVVDTVASFQSVVQTVTKEYFLTLSTIGPGRNLSFAGPADVTDVELKIPLNVSGRIVGADGQPLAGAVISTTTAVAQGVNMRSARRMRSETLSATDASFVLPIYPGESELSIVNLPTGFSVKSITYGSREMVPGAISVDNLPVSTLVITVDRPTK